MEKGKVVEKIKFLREYEKSYSVQEYYCWGELYEQKLIDWGVECYFDGLDAEDKLDILQEYDCKMSEVYEYIKKDKEKENYIKWLIDQYGIIYKNKIWRKFGDVVNVKKVKIEKEGIEKYKDFFKDVVRLDKDDKVIEE